jgi:hypothetical protein
MRLMLFLPLLALAACSDSGGDPHSDPHTQPHANSGVTVHDRAAMNTAQRAYADANDRMHSAMGNIPADADVAFVQGMIPHHQGAIDIARIVLEHGTDPENQALARAIIANQEAEIAGMRSWLERRNMAGVDATGAQVGDPDMAIASPQAPAEAAVDHSKMGH